MSNAPTLEDGSERTQVVRGIEDYAAREIGLDNVITADDMTRLLVALVQGRLAGPEATAACEQTLQAQEYRNGIPAGLPADVTVGNKTGWIDGVAHDVALVRPDDRPDYVLTVCTSADVDEGTLYDLNAAISAAAWDAWDDAGAGRSA